MSREQELRARYESAIHRQQSAVAAELEQELAGLDPRLIRYLKHLGVGVNNAMADQGALARVLVQEKKLLTPEQYLEAMTVAAEREADARSEEVRQKLGLPEGVRFT